MTKTTHLHSLAEGQRVNYLANLGGLVVLAGLDETEPQLLLGALTQMRKQLEKLPAERKLELKKMGEEKLIARNAEKRSFKLWQRSQQTERFDFTQEQMKKMIVAMGGKLPALEKDISSELWRLLRGVFGGT
jgi:hypothetical protein